MTVVSPILKSTLRGNIKNKLKSLETSYVESASQLITINLLNLQEFNISQSISIYLSMQREVDTARLVQIAMESNKRVFIPKITGKKFDDMFMLHVSNKQQLDSFPRDSWGIPDPPQDLIIPSLDGTLNGQIHCVIVPGVAFDSSCGRLGHGKGYYDNFLTRLSAENARLGLSPPVTIGLALDEQMVEAVPMDAHDRYLDFVITPSRIYSRQSH